MAIAEVPNTTSIVQLDPRPSFPPDSILNNRRILIVLSRPPFYDAYVPLDLIADPKVPVDQDQGLLT